MAELLPDEHVLYKARVSWIAYISAILALVILMVTGGLSGLVTTELVLTNKRVTGKRGLFVRKKINVTHAEIAAVNVRRGMLGALCDYGTITILTKGGSKIAFKGISMPFYVQQQIEEAVEVAVLGRRLSDYVGDTDV
jgi:uncharacterized membrane protein YdbT with pleckstrin-like domain